MNKPTHRFYDGTGGGCTKDILAESLEDAIQQGRSWIENGDWKSEEDDSDSDGKAFACTKTIELECSVGEILYRPILRELPSVLLDRLLWDPDYIDGYWCVCVAQNNEQELCEALAKESGGVWQRKQIDSDGDVILRWIPPADCETEEDEKATQDAERHDCSGRYENDEPDCPVSEGWDFVGTVEAGLSKFGCMGHGGTAMTHYFVCRNTGVQMHVYEPGSQRNPDEPLQIKRYFPRDEKTEEFVIAQHTDGDGFIPAWLADYFKRSPSTHMTKDEATEWVESHTDDDELDNDELEHAFAAIAGRRADNKDRREGLWSHLCQLVSG